MDYLVAKLKGSNTDFLKVMATAEEILEVPDVSDSEVYSPDYKLEDNQWYRLENFSTLGYGNSLLDAPFTTTDFNQINRDQYSRIEYFCLKHDDILLFQKMSSTQLLRKKWFEISGAPTLETERPIIVLNEWIDAVYDKNADILYFKDIARIKPMFRGIEELYREATQEEVDAFLDHGFVTLDDGYESHHIKTANRKRIALAMDTLNSFSDGEKRQIVAYTRTYCTEVACTDITFIVSNEEELKQVLFGIEQRYYTTPLRSEKRIANSILRLEN